MQTNIAKVTIFLIGLSIGSVGGYKFIKQESRQTQNSAPTEAIAQKSTIEPLSHPQRAWLGVIEWCESGGNPTAVNPKDKDGTPSYGLLQFKPGTFYGYAKRYRVKVTNYMNPDEQEAVMVQLILHSKEIDWSQQFPACTRKNGVPPLNKN